MEEKKHSKRYDRVKYWYEWNFWSKEMVRNAVGRWITEEEYEEITGEKFKKDGD